MAKRFFYVCGGLLMLAFAYHLGATDSRAQAGTTPIGIALDQSCGQPTLYVFTANGDVYSRQVYTCTGQMGLARFRRQLDYAA